MVQQGQSFLFLMCNLFLKKKILNVKAEDKGTTSSLRPRFYISEWKCWSQQYSIIPQIPVHICFGASPILLLLLVAVHLSYSASQSSWLSNVPNHHHVLNIPLSYQCNPQILTMPQSSEEKSKSSTMKKYSHTQCYMLIIRCSENPNSCNEKYSINKHNLSHKVQ